MHGVASRAHPPGGAAAPAWWLAPLAVVAAPWLDDQAQWPAWFGGLVAVLGLALGCAALRPAALATRLDRPARLLASCLALLIGLALLQTVPLGGALAWVSPATVAARQPFCEPDGVASCLSLDPHLTRVGALAWGGAAVVALLAARVLPARTVCAWLVLGGVGQALLALPQAGALTRARGCFVSPNNLAALLAMLLPVALALSGVGQRRASPEASRAGPRAWLAAAALLALGLVATRSRGGVAAAVVAVGAWSWWVRLARGRRAVWAAGMVAGLALALGADLLLDRFARLADGAEGANRLAYWAVGWQIFSRFPLLGAGLRSHPALTPELFPGPRLLTATHNDFLNLLADCGLVGGALGACALGAFVGAARRSLRSVPAGGSRHALLAACLAASLGMAVVSSIDFGLQVPGVLWSWAALAGIAAGGDPGVRAPRRSPDGWRLALGAGLGLAALCLAFQASRLALSRWALAQARAPGTQPEQRWASFARAARLWPEQGWIDLEWGRALRGAGDLTRARQALARAARKSPRDPWTHLELARVAAAPVVARGERERARRLAPRDPAVRLEAGRLALLSPGRGARVEGLADLNEAVRAAPPLLEPALAAILVRPDAALADCEALLADAPPGLRRRCVAALEARWPEPARQLLEPLLAAAGCEARDLAQAAGLDARLGRPERARDEWRAAAHAAREAGPLLGRGARELERLGRQDLAGALLEELTTTRPDDPGVWVELGRHLLRTRRPVEARPALERALGLDPRVGALELGQAWAAAGRLDSAILAWTRGVGAAPPALRAELQYRIAGALLDKGERARALESARAALASDPDHAGARELLRRLGAKDLR